MLAIRLQRLGRKGYPVYRLVVQDSRRHPVRGDIVAQVGTYNPHTKEIKLEIAELQRFLDNGAQPSDRVVKLLADQRGIKLPKWVKVRPEQKKAIRNPEKLRRNQPKETAAGAASAEEKVSQTEAEVAPAKEKASEKEAEAKE